MCCVALTHSLHFSPLTHDNLLDGEDSNRICLFVYLSAERLEQMGKETMDQLHVSNSCPWNKPTSAFWGRMAWGKCCRNKITDPGRVERRLLPLFTPSASRWKAREQPAAKAKTARSFAGIGRVHTRLRSETSDSPPLLLLQKSR